MQLDIPEPQPDPVPEPCKVKRTLSDEDPLQKRYFLRVRARRNLIKEDIRAVFNTENQYLLPSEVEERWLIEEIKDSDKKKAGGEAGASGEVNKDADIDLRVNKSGIEKK
jgi:hypothetical protein